MNVLIDTQILAFAITHRAAFTPNGKKKWGGVVEIETGYVARVPVYSAESTSNIYRSICYLAGISYLARTGAIRLFTTQELEAEAQRQPISRFNGIDAYDLNLFNGIDFSVIKDKPFGGESAGFFEKGFESAKRQRARMADIDDPLYRRLAARLSDNKTNKHSQDAWHIRTAELFGMNYFLTMDFKLRNLVRNKEHLEPLNSLHTKIVTPEEFGTALGLIPIPPDVVSYQYPDFPIHSEFRIK